MYRRARDYGLRGLALERPEFARQLRADPRRAVAGLSAAEVPLLYWTGVSWGALIGLSKSNPDVLGELMKESDAAVTQTMNAFGDFVTQVAAAEDGSRVLGKFGFVESAFDFALARVQLLA